MLVSKTPVRIEIGGGATDVEPYCSDFGGFVINVTIDLFVRTIITKRSDKELRIFFNDKDEPYLIKKVDNLRKNENFSDLIKAIIFQVNPKCGLNIYIHSEAPKMAGLGASASLSTSLIGAILKIQKKEIILEQIAENAYYIEQNLLKNEGGRQDQYASVFGGFNELSFFGGDNVTVKSLKLNNNFKGKIMKNLILFYTGEEHVSGNLVAKQVSFYLDEKKKARDYLDKLKEIALDMRDCLLEQQFEGFGQKLTEDWIVKSEFNPYLTTDYMRELNKLVINNGGIGGRVCGAGGGGCMVWLIKPNSRKKITALLSKKKGKLLILIL